MLVKFVPFDDCITGGCDPDVASDKIHFWLQSFSTSFAAEIPFFFSCPKVDEELILWIIEDEHLVDL